MDNFKMKLQKQFRELQQEKQKATIDTLNDISDWISQKQNKTKQKKKKKKQN